MKVALYARVSKSDKDKDGEPIQKPENQLIRLRKYAKEHDYEVIDDYVYVDRASGADPNRPNLEKMLSDARAHRFSLILVVKIDRMARSMRNLHTILTELESFGVKFHCIDQPEVSTDTSMGKLLLNILGAVAEFERELISERTKAGLERAVAQGTKLGRKYEEIDFEKVATLKAQGWGIKRIAKDLGIAPETLRRGLTREGGKPSKAKGGESTG